MLRAPDLAAATMTSFDRPSHGPTTPSSWVARFAPLIKAQGTVLDLACGDGRHTRFLRQCGLQVVAADVDTSGLADLANDPYVEVFEADLELGDWPFVHRKFDGVVITNYIHRPHFPYLRQALAPGGFLIIETFGSGNETFGRPRNPDFLLQPGELLQAFCEVFTVVAYEHGYEASPRPAVRQRICAAMTAEPVALHST